MEPSSIGQPRAPTPPRSLLHEQSSGGAKTSDFVHGDVANSHTTKNITENTQHAGNETFKKPGEERGAKKPRTKGQGRKGVKMGCLTCRKRRIKCGEEHPICQNCIKTKRQCEGYSQRVWFKGSLGDYHQPASSSFDHSNQSGDLSAGDNQTIVSDDGQNITVKKGDRSLSQEPNPELKQVAGNDSDAELPSTGKETIVESDWKSFNDLFPPDVPDSEMQNLVSGRSSRQWGRVRPKKVLYDLTTDLTTEDEFEETLESTQYRVFLPTINSKSHLPFQQPPNGKPLIEQYSYPQNQDIEVSRTDGKVPTPNPQNDNTLSQNEDEENSPQESGFEEAGNTSPVDPFSETFYFSSKENSHRCKRCTKYSDKNDAIDCAICSNTYHMSCVNPPLLRKPARGFAWACSSCSKAQEKILEVRSTPDIVHLEDDNKLSEGKAFSDSEQKPRDEENLSARTHHPKEANNSRYGIASGENSHFGWAPTTLPYPQLPENTPGEASPSGFPNPDTPTRAKHGTAGEKENQPQSGELPQARQRAAGDRSPETNNEYEDSSDEQTMERWGSRTKALVVPTETVENSKINRLENSTEFDNEAARGTEEELDKVSFFYAPNEDGTSPPRTRRGSNTSSRRDRSTSPPASFWAALKRKQMTTAPPESTQQGSNTSWKRERSASPVTPFLATLKREQTVIAPPEGARRDSNTSSRRDRSTSPPASFWAALKRQQEEYEAILQSRNENEENNDEEAWLERAAEIRKNVADRAARQASGKGDHNRDTNSDNEVDSDGESIESRVARIKVRVAELTGNMPEKGGLSNPTNQRDERSPGIQKVQFQERERVALAQQQAARQKQQQEAHQRQMAAAHARSQQGMYNQMQGQESQHGHPQANIANDGTERGPPPTTRGLDRIARNQKEKFSQDSNKEGDDSGEETIESKVARIKARVAELIGKGYENTPQPEQENATSLAYPSWADFISKQQRASPTHDTLGPIDPSKAFSIDEEEGGNMQSQQRKVDVGSSAPQSESSSWGSRFLKLGFGNTSSSTAPSDIPFESEEQDDSSQVLHDKEYFDRHLSHAKKENTTSAAEIDELAEELEGVLRPPETIVANTWRAARWRTTANSTNETRVLATVLNLNAEDSPEDPDPKREGEDPPKTVKTDDVPPDAKWTKISRKLVNTEALERGREKYELRDEFVIVLRVLSREEIQDYADTTEEIRATRAKARENENRDNGETAATKVGFSDDILSNKKEPSKVVASTLSSQPNNSEQAKYEDEKEGHKIDKKHASGLPTIVTPHMEGMKDRTEGTEKATAPTKMNEATASSTYMGDSTTVESHTESSTTHASASRRSNREASTKRRVGREELDILEREFKRNPRPTTSQKQDLAEFIGVDPRQLNNWFQNRRAMDIRGKKQAANEAGDEAGYEAERETFEITVSSGDWYPQIPVNISTMRGNSDFFESKKIVTDSTSPHAIANDGSLGYNLDGEHVRYNQNQDKMREAGTIPSSLEEKIELPPLFTPQEPPASPLRGDQTFSAYTERPKTTPKSTRLPGIQSPEILENRLDDFLHKLHGYQQSWEGSEKRQFPSPVPSPEFPGSKTGDTLESVLAPGSSSSSPEEIPFTPEDDVLLADLKENKALPWFDIAKFFPGRNLVTLHARYSTKLKPVTRRTDGTSIKIPWSLSDDRELARLVMEHGPRWNLVSKEIKKHAPEDCEQRYFDLYRPKGEMRDDEASILESSTYHKYGFHAEETMNKDFYDTKSKEPRRYRCQICTYDSIHQSSCKKHMKEVHGFGEGLINDISGMLDPVPYLFPAGEDEGVNESIFPNTFATRNKDDINTWRAERKKRPGLLERVHSSNSLANKQLTNKNRMLKEMFAELGELELESRESDGFLVGDREPLDDDLETASKVNKESEKGTNVEGLTEASMDDHPRTVAPANNGLPASILPDQTSNVERLWPGMHQQQALAKAQAKQRQQQQIIQQQKQNANMRPPVQSSSRSSPPPADPIVQEQISQLLNSTKQDNASRPASRVSISTTDTAASANLIASSDVTQTVSSHDTSHSDALVMASLIANSFDTLDGEDALTSVANSTHSTASMLSPTVDPLESNGEKLVETTPFHSSISKPQQLSDEARKALRDYASSIGKSRDSRRSRNHLESLTTDEEEFRGIKECLDSIAVTRVYFALEERPTSFLEDECKEFHRELIKKGYTSQSVMKHKKQIQTFVTELHRKGVLLTQPSAPDLRESSRTHDSTRAQSEKDDYDWGAWDQERPSNSAGKSYEESKQYDTGLSRSGALGDKIEGENLTLHSGSDALSTRQIIREDDEMSLVSSTHDTMSIVSIDSVFSLLSGFTGSSASSLQSSQDVIERLVVLFLGDETIRPACSKALEIISRERFERNLRRLLKSFAVALRQEATSEDQRDTARFVLRRATNTAHLICNKLQQPHRPKQIIVVEDEIEEPDEDSESDRSENFDSLQHLETFIKESNAMDALRTSLIEFVEQNTLTNAVNNANPCPVEDPEEMVQKSECVSDVIKTDITNASQETETKLEHNVEDIQATIAVKQNWKATLTHYTAGTTFWTWIVDSTGTVAASNPFLRSNCPSKLDGSFAGDTSLLDFTTLPRLRLERMLVYVRNSYQLPDFVDRLIKLDSMRSLLVKLELIRPPVKPGKKRVEWKCKCGHKIFDDFTETKSGAAQRFQVERIIKNSQPASDSSKSNVFSGILANIRSLIGQGNEKGAALPMHERSNPCLISSTPSTLSTSSTLNTPNPQTQPPKELLYLLLCYNEGRYATRLLQVDLTSKGAACDKALFKLLRSNYQSMRGKFLSHLSFRTLTSMKFVSFELYRSQLVDVRKQDDIPPPSHKDYRYQPAPPELIPPIGERHMMHLFSHPDHAEDEPICLDRFPKKLKEKLLCRGGSNPGWGLQFVEGWDMRKVWGLVFFLFGLGSLLIGVLWSVFGHSIQDAFTMAGYMVAMATVSMGTIQAFLTS